jgi:hypothetical protein
MGVRHTKINKILNNINVRNKFIQLIISRIKANQRGLVGRAGDFSAGCRLSSALQAHQLTGV